MCVSINSGMGSSVMARRDSGVALITALAFLVLFSLIGSAYVGYMLIERSEVSYEIHQMRARHAAEAGVQAAIGALGRQLQAGPVTTPAEFTVGFPMYQMQGEVLAADEGAYPEAVVWITDENARVNLNFAPLGVLESIVGIDRETWRQIRSSMPRVGDHPDADHQWLARVDDLVARGVNTEDFDRLDRDLLTVYTGEDLLNPRGFININTASPEVIAAVLNIPMDRAAAVAQGPPMQSIEEVAAAAGKDSAMFTMPPVPGAPPNAAAAIGFSSRTFRIVSTSRWHDASGARPRKSGARVEAVVLFRADGTPEIRYWAAGRADVDALSEAAPEEDLAAPEQPQAVPAEEQVI